MPFGLNQILQSSKESNYPQNLILKASLESVNETRAIVRVPLRDMADLKSIIPSLDVRTKNRQAIVWLNSHQHIWQSRMHATLQWQS